ncbi:hypothetical protein BKA57DRAFT_116011 [Linnemannia elongata]|nr:hypothetical protein BKA57DRAFT_116011 [Linnemannia elongata]
MKTANNSVARKRQTTSQQPQPQEALIQLPQETITRLPQEALIQLPQETITRLPQEDPVPAQQLQEALALFQQSQETLPQQSQERLTQLPQEEPVRQVQEAVALLQQLYHTKHTPAQQPQPLGQVHGTTSSAQSTVAAAAGDSVKRKRRITASATTFEEAVSDGSASEAELNQSLQARTPKRTRGRQRQSLNARVEQEFSALMKVLSTCRNTNAVVGGEGSQGSSSAAHELCQRGTMFRLQGMNFENENLACNTKDAYSVYLKLFQVRA